MKKLLLLALLFPVIGMAQFHPGTITLNDGSTKTGLIELPTQFSSDNIKFKTNEKEKAEKLNVEDVKNFTATTKGIGIKYITLKLADGMAFTAKYKIAKKKSWVRVEREDKINIVTAYINNFTEGKGYKYYIHKPWEEHCYFITAFYGGAVLQMGQYKNISDITDIIFKDDCPKLSESFTKDDFKKKGLDMIVDNYKQNCK